jgi:secreted PhoX family phosphatase
MDDSDQIGSNPTSNPSLDDIITARIGRRGLLGGGLVAAAAGLFGGTFLAGPAGATTTAPAALGTGTGTAKRSRLGFGEVAPSTDDAIRVPEGYVAQVLAPWGTPLFYDSPAWKPDASNTAAEQAKQVGFNHDGLKFFPLGTGPNRNRNGVLVVNHEYTDAAQIYTAAQGSAITPDAAGREKVAKALAAHGVTVMEIERDHYGTWQVVRGSWYNRRITGTTPVTFSGPVRADHPMLQSELGNPALGTLNNCAHGSTPWGTYLTCEENWNGYFGTDDASWTPNDVEKRYGVSKAGFGYDWHKAEARFDLARNRKELNRFGWVVEIDPWNPTSTPVKRTALGRIKHEGATCTEHNGHLVVYTGDDENGDYLYKFVSKAPWRKMRAYGTSPLDEGTLYVARFSDDGTATWLPLVHGTGVLSTANGWADQADVLIRTRLAADAVGATRLHRPEWVSVDERTGNVYVTMTNGSVNNAAAANSARTANPYGHILRFNERGAAANTFRWDIFVFAGDPQYPALGGTKIPAGQPLFGSPDGVWVDQDGLVWIQTDISNSAQNRADRGYDRIGNNQMLVADPETGEIKRFLTGPRGCEITGVNMTPDRTTMFVNVQHPGESTTFWDRANGEPTVAAPRTVSNWPEFSPSGRPRSATVVIRRKDGGKLVG